MLHAEVINLAFLLRQLNTDLAVGAKAVLVTQNCFPHLFIALAAATAEMLPGFLGIMQPVLPEKLRLLLAFINTFHERLLRN